MIQLRPYQERAVAQLRSVIGAGKRRPILVAATGSGKTVCAVAILLGALAKGSRVLFLAHRRELIKQPLAKLVRAGIPYDQIGIIMAGVESARSGLLPFALEQATDDQIWSSVARRRPVAPIQIGSIDTIRARGVMPPADLVVIDECHRSCSAGYVKLIEAYPKAIILGMTATPVRADGQPLGTIFDEMVHVASYRELAEQGYLVIPRVFTVPAQELPDLGNVKIAKSGLNKGDYDHAELIAAVDKTGLVGDLVEHYQTHGNGAPAIAFAVSVDHSKHIVERFCDAGIPALHVDGETPTAERDAAIRKLREGEVKLLSNVDVFTEGTDVPCVKVIILARPTKSLRVYLQQVGRGSRPYGDLPFIILDHAGCVLEHGLPQDDREYSLTSERKRKKKDPATTPKTCPCCYAVLPAQARSCGTVQPQGKPCRCGAVCGYVFGQEPGERGVPEENEGKLIEVRAADTDEKRAYWEQLCHTAVERGYKPGWAKYKYKDKFKVWPPTSFGVPDIPRPIYSEDEKHAELEKLIRIGQIKGYEPTWAVIRYTAKFGHGPDMAEVSRIATQEPVPWAI